MFYDPRKTRIVVFAPVAVRSASDWEGKWATASISRQSFPVQVRLCLVGFFFAHSAYMQ